MDEKSPEERVRESLENINVKVKSRFGIKRTFKMIGILCIVFLSLAAVLLLLSLIKIKSIEIVGAEGVYNESLVCETAEVYHGMSLFDSTSWGISSKLKDRFPMIDDVKVKKKLSGKLIIEIDLYEFEYFVSYDGLFYGVDSGLTVTDARTSSDEYVSLGARYLSLPEIESPLTKNLVFSELFEKTDEDGEVIQEAKDKKDFEYVYTFLDFLVESGYFNETNAVMLDRKFDISIVWAGKYLINFGDVTGLDTKTYILERILTDESLKYAEKAVIDVSEPSTPYARPDSSLDFSDYVSPKG